jgi:argonaute-like protein implicated in RNA metabolism and viral defense
LNRTNQSTIIKEAINSYLDKGVTDKQDIYTKVVDELGVPRPTVRRVARDLRTELLQKIQILQSDMPKATVQICQKQLLHLKKTNKLGSFFFLIILFCDF